MPLFIRRSFLPNKPLASTRWDYKSNQLQLNYLEHNSLVLYRLISTLVILLALCGYSWKVTAATLYTSGQQQLNLNTEAGLGWFNSSKSYQGANKTGSSTWHEAYLKLDLHGSHTTTAGNFYAGLGGLASATGGAGDAAGLSTGSEATASLENLFLGWKSAQLLPQLGTDGLQVSVGRQTYKLGRGFLINGDGLSFGKGAEPDIENRGGAYYMAPRQSFANTLIIQLGQATSWQAQAFYLDSDNQAQDELNLHGINLTYSPTGASWNLTGLRTTSDRNEQRDGLEVYSLGYQSNLGLEQLFIAAEVVQQQQGDSSADATAGYVELSWTFNQLAGQPKLSYRYSRFSHNYDALLFGFNDVGTWFQGEVAANYAGPYNENASIHFLGLKTEISPQLQLGVNLFKFSTLNKQNENLDANELNFFLDYFPFESLLVSPLLSLYKPDADSSHNGSQLGSNTMNTYAQLTLMAFF